MATLTSILARVRALLMDGGAQVWADADLTEGIRLAVGEYGLASDAPAALEGLDGAAVTSNAAQHETGIVWGAAAYAALARAVDRAESFTLGSTAQDLKEWGEARLKEYKAMLGVIFPGYLAVLAGSAGGADPAKTAAEVALLAAQAELAAAQTALTAAQSAAEIGQEGRAAAQSAQAAADRAAEAARLAELRAAAGSPWGKWEDPGTIDYGAGWDRK